MRFQTVEKIPGREPDAVLRAMEEGLREISSEMVREGQRITLMGLGPSPRARNRRDRTVIDVKATDGVTLIEVDVTYQASAFLGEASQNVVVQEKLDRVFDEMRAQLGLERSPVYARERNGFSHASGHADSMGSETPKMRYSAVALEEMPIEPVVAAIAEPVVEAAAPVVVEAESVVESKPTEVATAKSESAEAVVEIAASAAAKEISNTKFEVENDATEVVTVPEPPKEMEPVAKKEPPVKPAVSTRLIAERRRPAAVSLAKALETDVMGPVALAEIEPVSESARSTGLLMGVSESFEDEKKSKQWIAWVVAVVLVLAPMAWLYLPSQFRGDSEQAPVQRAVQPEPAQAAVPAPPPAPLPGSEADPAAMVKEWETALQSNDAAKQAAFYAGTVDRYFLRHDVSRGDIEADKQERIGKRQEGWTLAMERVQVKQKDDAATVHLVKHYVVRQNDKVVSQWFVPSQLQLKRADGRWQITSERDLGWGTSLEELGY
ncbi:MAG TPA: hypothetical protein VL495_04520 [Edaphobacter sp.]|nr:hypothetical protein [Edaphobacter sp.]